MRLSMWASHWSPYAWRCTLQLLPAVRRIDCGVEKSWIECQSPILHDRKLNNSHHSNSPKFCNMTKDLVLPPANGQQRRTNWLRNVFLILPLLLLVHLMVRRNSLSYQSVPKAEVKPFKWRDVCLCVEWLDYPSSMSHRSNQAHLWTLLNAIKFSNVQDWMSH